MTTIHLLGLPHTVTRGEWSHCAYTGKALRFAPMMQSVGFRVVHYGNEGAQTWAVEQVDVLSQEVFEGLHGKYDPANPAFVGDRADTGSVLYQTFNARLGELLVERVQKGDIIACPFGHAHQAALRPEVWERAFVVETGIGYPTTFARFRIFESNAWMHWHLGKADARGDDYNWVIPNYFDVSEWDYQPHPRDYVLYFGRLSEIKGLQIVTELAKHTRRMGLQTYICGQGDPTPWLENGAVHYMPPIHGRDRSRLLGGARCVVMPTRYVEPFGGVAVEAGLCGTPVLGATFGAFTETIEHGLTGFRCRTLGDWVKGVELCEYLDRASIREWYATRYDMLKLAHTYKEVFDQLVDLHGEGWYSMRSPLSVEQLKCPRLALAQ